MLTKRREQSEYFDGENVSFSCMRGDHHTIDSASFPIEPHFYSTLFEESVVNSGGGRGDKDYEHYKIARNTPSSALSSTRVYARMWEFEPHYYAGQVTALRSLTKGPDGAGVVLPFGEPGFPIQGLPVLWDPRSDGGFVPAPASLGELLDRASRSIVPQIKAELSSINSLIELKDFASFPQFIRDLTNFKFRNFKSWRSYREFLRLGGEGYLQWKFAFAPLLSDIKGVINALSRVESELRSLINRSVQPQTVHHTMTVNEFGDTPLQDSDKYYAFRTPPFPAGFPQHTLCFMQRLSKADLSVFHAEVSYNLSFNDFQLEHARVLALLDALGVNFNPAIIWNATKWTFLVDWVLGVGQWLSSKKVLNLEPKVNITRSCWSVKRRREVHTWKCSISDGTLDIPTNETAVAMPVVVETAYRRGKGFLSSSQLTTGGLDPTKVSLGAALVLVQGPRRNPAHRSVTLK